MRQTLDIPVRETTERLPFRKRRLMRRMERIGASFGLGFFLACISFGRRTLPLAACLCCVSGGFASLFSSFGAIIGYFLMFPFLDALEPAAATVMLYCLSAIFRQSDLQEKPYTFPFLAFCSTCSVGLVYAIGDSHAAFLWLILRCGLCVGWTYLLAYFRKLQTEKSLPRESGRNRIADSLRLATRLLRHEEVQTGNLEVLYDNVCDQVCLYCPGYHHCYEVCSAETYRMLRIAAKAFVPKGIATAADFPTDFLKKCKRVELFVGEINAQLDAHLVQMQNARRQMEYRTILCEHYRILSELLGSREKPCAKQEPRFHPEVGVRALGRHGSHISGDQGACFVERGILYLFLCDGMGTGSDAAQESRAAVALLGSFLKAGATPEEALHLLNGLYIFRATSCFSTVDLLELDLSTGCGELYKWGAAPSYLVSRHGAVKKIGTVTPPPGLSQDALPDRRRLSLQKGEKLVLVSDGALDSAEVRLQELWAEEPQKIASGIIAQHTEGGEDDMSAVVLCLRPNGAGESIS